MNLRSISFLAIVLLAAFTPLLGCERGPAPDLVGPSLGSGPGAGIDSAPESSAPSGQAAVVRPHFDPEDFVRRVDNPFFPLVPGTAYRYSGETAEGIVTSVFKVTHATKRILGVTTIEIRDRVFLNGELQEDTFDWFAQDEEGNVWYFGEDTKEYENGQVVSTAGTWLAGRDGAEQGIIMLAHPRVGDSYRQEFAVGVAEDMARVVSLNKAVKVPYGRFRQCLQTLETTALEPDLKEDKYYARGIGNLLTVNRATGERIELISVSRR